ncbi:unnamed protein product [Pleuronectes platessa]|uniref:Uncharacterized protein n=1 Tax=Pleuronectes platessa TaxID=8262 RepID=A0A9N7U6V6_PLEPL|nr:unnamed protein product [Pleuronectes platessa]
MTCVDQCITFGSLDQLPSRRKKRSTDYLLTPQGSHSLPSQCRSIVLGLLKRLQTWGENIPYHGLRSARQNQPCLCSAVQVPHGVRRGQGPAVMYTASLVLQYV